ncbi:hypothetical protein DdX_20293 [Ditylenchus destructor]|uniref:Uncharacterized protein n=1 Tax=Ditylenchus destructor TaxID=166010 RepID=A0AAD4MGK4_9BILA|nr:hypothetical protein DdX_20293 [Ditylenchus destructor]
MAGFIVVFILAASLQSYGNCDYTTVEASEGTVSTGTLGTLNEDDKLKKLGEVVLNTWKFRPCPLQKQSSIIEGGVVKEIVTAYTVLWAAYRIIEFGYELYSNEAGADERCRTTRICTWVKKKTGQKIVPNESRKIANELLELMRKVERRILDLKIAYPLVLEPMITTIFITLNDD